MIATPHRRSSAPRPTLLGSRWFAIALTALVAVGLVVAALAPAQAQAQAQAAAGFSVRVIEGTRAATAKVDPRLSDLQRELGSLHQDYNTFSLVSTHNLRLQVGQRNQLKLPDGADMALQLLEIVQGPPMRVRHALELPKSKSIRSVAPGGRTLDVRAGSDRLIIICTTVEK